MRIGSRICPYPPPTRSGRQIANRKSSIIQTTPPHPGRGGGWGEKLFSPHHLTYHTQACKAQRHANASLFWHDFIDNSRLDSETEISQLQTSGSVFQCRRSLPSRPHLAPTIVVSGGTEDKRGGFGLRNRRWGAATMGWPC